MRSMQVDFSCCSLHNSLQENNGMRRHSDMHHREAGKLSSDAGTGRQLWLPQFEQHLLPRITTRLQHASCNCSFRQLAAPSCCLERFVRDVVLFPCILPSLYSKQQAREGAATADLTHLLCLQKYFLHLCLLIARLTRHSHARVSDGELHKLASACLVSMQHKSGCPQGWDFLAMLPRECTYCTLAIDTGSAGLPLVTAKADCA